MDLSKIKAGTILGFSDLSAEKQNKYIQKEIENNNDCFETVAEALIDRLKGDLYEIGIDVDDIFYSGFWSQGDGAMFTGTLFIVPDVEKALLEIPGINDNFRNNVVAMQIALSSMPEGVDVKIEHSSIYCHENTAMFSWNYDCSEDTYEEWLRFHGEDELFNIQHTVEECCRSLMIWCYAEIEKEYEDQTSEETAREHLKDCTWEVVEYKTLEML